MSDLDPSAPEGAAKPTRTRAAAAPETRQGAAERSFEAAPEGPPRAVDPARSVSDAGLGMAQEAAGRTLESTRRAQAAGLQMQRDAVEAGRDLARTGQRALDQTSDLWRQAFQPLASIHMEMNRLVDDVWRTMTGMTPGAGMHANRAMGAGFANLLGAPAADLKETDAAYVLYLEVPGLRREDVDIGLRDDALVVSGHKSEARDQGAGAYRLSERRYGRFERAFPLPRDVRREAVDATLQDGILTITLPKTEEAAQAWRKIEVH